MASAKNKILIVDDNIQIRRTMRDYLTQLGFTDITEAENGRFALDHSKKSLPDIITLDWNMPEMDGLTFLLKLRKLPGGDKPKVIFCSTEDSPAKIQKVLSSGADDYITKPFNLATIRDSLNILGLIKS